MPRGLVAARQDLVMEVAAQVAGEAGVAISEILSASRRANIVAARNRIALALWRRGVPLAGVGRAIGRDHSSVINGLHRLLGKDAYRAEAAERYPMVRAGRRSDAEHFWDRTRPNGECVDWAGYLNASGYGRLRWNATATLAHRVAWEIVHGPIPPRMMVCHRCDRPSCVKPDHLFLGTQADNVADCSRKGRTSGGEARSLVVRGVSNGNAKFSDETVRLVREMAAAGRPRAEIREAAGASKTWVAYVLEGRLRCGSYRGKFRVAS